MSLLQQQPLVQKIKLFVYRTNWYQLKQSLTNNKHTKKIPFSRKNVYSQRSADQQIDYFLLINNVPDFEKNVNSLSE